VLIIFLLAPEEGSGCSLSKILALFSGFLYDTIRLFIHEEDLWYKNDGFDLGDYSNPAASTVMSRKGSVRTATSLTLLASTPPS